MTISTRLMSPGWFGLAALALVAKPVAADAAVFQLTGTNVVVDAPAPLFASDIVTGVLTLDDSVLPGESFGSDAIIGLTLNFGGIVGTLANIAADVAPGPVQAFGTRSLDGTGFSVFDLRFGFVGVAGCSFVCAGQIIINSPIGPADTSNFIAIDDAGGATLSVISSFTPEFSLLTGVVPEPASWALMVTGFGLLGATLRLRRDVVAA